MAPPTQPGITPPAPGQEKEEPELWLEDDIPVDNDDTDDHHPQVDEGTRGGGHPMSTHAPAVPPLEEKAPKPVNPEPLQRPVDPEQRGVHPPVHTHVPQPERGSEHPQQDGEEA